MSISGMFSDPEVPRRVSEVTMRVAVAIGRVSAVEVTRPGSYSQQDARVKTDLVLCIGNTEPSRQLSLVAHLYRISYPSQLCVTCRYRAGIL